MEELIKRLHQELSSARLRVAVSTVPIGADIGYHFGIQQGVCKGLERALKLVDNFLNDIDTQNGDQPQ